MNFPGISVVPTWIAVREHTPVEIEKNYGNDEEPIEPEVISEDEKSKIAVVKGSEL